MNKIDILWSSICLKIFKIKIRTKIEREKNGHMITWKKISYWKALDWINFTQGMDQSKLLNLGLGDFWLPTYMNNFNELTSELYL